MKTLSAEHKRKMQEGRRRARAMRPQKLAEIERKMDAAGVVYRGAKAKLDYQLMADVRREIEALGVERKRLQDGPVES